MRNTQQAMETEIVDEISHMSFDGARNIAPRSTGLLSGKVSDYGTKGTVATEVTLSTVMGRMQATIDHVDTMIKRHSETVILLCGEKSLGAAVSTGDAGGGALSAGTIDEANRMLNALGSRLSELGTLHDMIAHRLS